MRDVKSILKALFPWAASSLLIVTTAMAADPPPFTIQPAYSSQFGIPIQAPKNDTALRSLLDAALGNSANPTTDPIDANAYYVLHRMVYDVDTNTLNDGGWYIYYQPWHRRSGFSGFLSWLDDPLAGGNYKRGRIYGSNNLHLVPVTVWPAVDFSAADDNVRRELETQAAQKIATDTTLTLNSALTTPGKVLPDLVNGARGSTVLTAAAFADPVSALQSSHMAPPDKDNRFAGMDVTKGDLLSDATAEALKAPAGTNLTFLKALAAWTVRETLIAYSQGKKDKMGSIVDVTLATVRNRKPVALSSVVVGNRTFYLVTDLVDANTHLIDAKKIKQILPSYRVTVAARQPQPASDFKDLLSLIGAQGGLLTLTVDQSNAAFQSLFAVPVASTADELGRVGSLSVDITFDAIKPGSDGSTQQKAGGAGGGAGAQADTSGQSTQTNNVLSSVKLQNEKKYLYGLSAGIPVKSFDDVQYDSTNAIISAKKIQKQNVYAFLQFHPYATDTTGARLRLLPTFMAGLPLAGKPLDQQVYAGSIGLWRVEVFAGVLLHRDLVPTGNAAANTTPNPAATAGSLQPRWGTRLTYGIDIPISVIKSALSSKSSTSNTTAAASSAAGAGGGAKTAPAGGKKGT